MRQAASVIATALLVLAGAGARGQIALNEKEYFSGPGFSFLVFHNNYIVGYQGGLQMIQNGERILDSGDLLLRTKPGTAAPAKRVLRREVDRERGTATVHGEIPEWGTGYRLVCRTDGKRIFVKAELDGPVDWSRVEEAGLQIALYPPAYYAKAYLGDAGGGVFPRQYGGRPVLLEGTGKLRVAPDDPLYSLEIASPKAELRLEDRRRFSARAWFWVVAPLERGSAQTTVEMAITPTLRPEWRRPPVIGINQVGYHPRQPKRAVVELDPREEPKGRVRLYRLRAAGSRELVKEARLEDRGRFLRFRYGVFDFSEVRRPGVYVVEYRGERAGPFRIGADVFEEAWRPTLEYFLPSQMCHVLVRKGNRVIHGLCHLDDARQAPANTPHLDGYHQRERETRYADDEHVPGLDWGGWHDAGDNDIPAGSLCRTIQPLALAVEEFGAALDQTSIDRKARQVRLYTPDGEDDLLQQIAYGVEWLLAAYRAGGHIFPGVIARDGLGYSIQGDMASATDNLVYDPKLGPDEVVGRRSGKRDDRWVFTNRNTGLQYLTAQTLAMAYRVLRKERPRLAGGCLETAEKLWRYEQEHDPVWTRNAYTPGDSGFRAYEMAATAELWLTTKKETYREHLISLTPVLEGIGGVRFGEGPGWTLVRALETVEDAGFRAAVRRLAERWKRASERRMAGSPYGVLYPEGVLEPEYKLEERSGIHSGFVWGHGWGLQAAAMRQYFFHKHLPELFGPEAVLNTVDYVLGRHPATNHSFVSGVGARSTLITYVFNRPEWTYQPGGVISGTSLVKPDYLELKADYPFLWYQTEIVIGGAGSWIFDVLAAQKLAGE